MAAIPFTFERSMSMSKKTTTPKAAKSGLQVRKDAKGRFWLVPKDGGAEQGPFATKKAALDAKAGKVDGAPEPAAAGATTESKKPAKAGKAKKTKQPKDKKLSAIDAAAQVLAGSKGPMNAKQMIEALAAKALWTSPGGKTPHATLYSAIIREIAIKGKDSRFVKAERGKFAAK
jgi:HB1, ASXL, restriction endonuclease HTH domain